MNRNDMFFTIGQAEKMNISATDAEAINASDGIERWELLAAAKPKLSLGYEVLSIEESAAHRKQFLDIANEGSGRFMFVCEIVPIVKSDQFGWFGFPEEHVGDWGFAPVFVLKSWQFFEVVATMWNSVFLALNQQKYGDLPRESWQDTGLL